MSLRSLPPTGEKGWASTGRFELRRGWFGPVLFLEQTRREFRPIYIGHSPANWVRVVRWRRATNDDLSSGTGASQPLRDILMGRMFYERNVIPQSTLDIPMSPGTKPPPAAPRPL